jgi:DNA-binding HxlR family transcriptional regulator
MGGQKIETVRMSESAEKEMRAVAQKVMDQKIAELDKKGLPARKAYSEMKALAAKYSKM